MATYIPLNVHSEYSLINGIIKLPELIDHLKTHSIPAIALTDHANLFSAVKFYKACVQSGIKPLLGCEIWLMNEENPQDPHRFTLLCQNSIGYQNLIAMVSRSYLENQIANKAQIKKEWILTSHEGLIALSGGLYGDVGQALQRGDEKKANSLLQDWLSCFGDRYFLELQRVGRQEDEAYVQNALLLAEKKSVPVVATNPAYFLIATDYEAHEARVCIQSSHTLNQKNRPRLHTPQQYLRTDTEMQALFNDIPEALSNSVEIAKRCNMHLRLGEVFLPKFPVPVELSVEEYLEKITVEAWEIYSDQKKLDEEQKLRYSERLKSELAVINRMGFAGYFLIVADFIRWAKANDIPVGPGRGSGVGSLAAFLLGITGLDPLKHDLLFERFLNPERISLPDFDVDFCMKGRDRVIHYVAERYGVENVSQIITYGTMAARAVVRDVGRVLSMPYGLVDKIAKLIPFELGMTLEKALAQETELEKIYQREEGIKYLIDRAKKLEGLTRSAGKHAGGVVIAPERISRFVPLYCEEGGAHPLTQFDKDDIETMGLVKFDFLGLRTLTIIHRTQIIVNEERKQNQLVPLDINTICIDDSATYQLLQDCKTTAVFQLESRGMKDLIKRLLPDCFEDIIALVALFRPGPLQSGMVDDFINRKHKLARVEYLHESLEPILRSTYGVILYQEQVMQIAQVLAGYSLGEADLLRRAMGKKKPEEMAQQRAFFIKGAAANQVSEELANTIFDLMEKFAGYGFNKSHAAAYALIAYQTAWLKCHYPAAFMAAVLSSDMDHTEKVVSFIAECRAMRLAITPPDINECEYMFTVKDNHTLRYGLGAIKGVGEMAIESIILERKKNGPFANLAQFCQRVDMRKVNRRVLEALIKAGALDCFRQHRNSLLHSLTVAIQAALQYAKSQRNGQGDLFADDELSVELPTQYVDAKPWSDVQRLQAEKEVLGLYLNGHLIDPYRDELQHFTTGRLIDIDLTRGGQLICIAGVVIHIRKMFTKRGQRMAFITIDDGTATVEFALFSELLEQSNAILVKDAVVILEAEVTADEHSGGFRLNARSILDLQGARLRFGRYIFLQMQADHIDGVAERLKPYVQKLEASSGLPVMVQYERDNVACQVQLASKWRVIPSESALTELRNEWGDQAVWVSY